MLYIAVTIFPIIAIVAGVVALVAVIRFIAQVYRDLRSQVRPSP
jgi:hypothetical protein